MIYVIETHAGPYPASMSACVTNSRIYFLDPFKAGEEYKRIIKDLEEHTDKTSVEFDDLNYNHSCSILLNGLGDCILITMTSKPIEDEKNRSGYR